MAPEFSAVSGVDKEGSGSKKKRPMGLKARAAATKKQKSTHHSNGDNNQSAADAGDTSSNTEPAATAGVNDFDEANMATIMLKGEATEIDELEGIFESAMGEVSAAAAEESTERAVTLLRGTIHECDRILRVHHHQHQNQSQTHKEGEDAADGLQPPPLQPKFYYIYGSALYSITELSDEQDGKEKETEKAEYLELALERLGQARDGMAGTEAFAWRVHMGMAKTALELMALGGGEEEGDADDEQQHNHSLAEAIESLDSALEAMRHDPAMEEEAAAAGESLGAVDLVLSLADSRRLAPELNARFVAWGESKLRGMLENPGLTATDTSSDIRYLLARALWLQASALLDAQDEGEDEDEDEDNEEKDDEGNEKIADLLRSASKLLGDASTSEALLLRGEVLLNLGNVQDANDAQEQLYEQAIGTFKRAQQIGQIPDSF
ncbi:hypothetical protein GGI11_002285, partial [Coemansia sp. RSA 2049]